MLGRWPSRARRPARGDHSRNPLNDAAKTANLRLLLPLCAHVAGLLSRSRDPRQIRLHLRNCFLEPVPQCLLHLEVLTIALKALERIAAII